jgi:hypothetical protein
MAANGLMYTVSFQNVNVTGAAQNLWEFIAAAGTGLLIHSIRLTFTPTIVSGVAQDVRAQLIIMRLTGTGTGGSATTPAPVNIRNTVAAVTTVNRLVTTVGTASTQLSADNVSIIVPYERIFTPDQRIPVPGGGRLALNLAATLGTTYSASSEIYFEEI